jgi:glycosyltransferase involved in cell wall biosynthesis
VRILFAHNRYQRPGGEDQVFGAEADLLASRGHTVMRYELHNDSIKTMRGLEVARNTIWNSKAAEEVATLVRDNGIEVAHFHNTFPVMSPAVYRAARREGAAVVQTLHNFRLICPACTLFRDGGLCSDCVGKAVPWPAVVHACYRGDRRATAVTAAMMAFHNAKGTWSNDVDAYVALSEFNRSLFCRAGFSTRSMYVKPNFLKSDPGPGADKRAGAVFAGRLVKEKGILTLLKAWEKIGSRLPLTILGDGPLRNEVATAAERSSGAVTWLGWRDHSEIAAILGEASIAICPSIWVEAGPLSVIESFARGTPIIASRLGTLGEWVQDGFSGHLFEAGNADSLVEAIGNFLTLPDGGAKMRENARMMFLDRYSPDRAYSNSLALYGFARENFQSSRVHG